LHLFSSSSPPPTHHLRLDPGANELLETEDSAAASASASSSSSSSAVGDPPCNKTGGMEQSENFASVVLANGARWLFNPSIAVPGGPGATPLRLGGHGIVFYRGQARILSTVHFRLFELPTEGGTSIAIPKMPPAKDLALGWITTPDRSISTCAHLHNMNPGFEDPRAIAWNGTIYVVTNSLNPELCRRGISVLQLNQTELFEAVTHPKRTNLVGIAARSVTHLVPPGGFGGPSQ
jgi:hypothetical protein